MKTLFYFSFGSSLWVTHYLIFTDSVFIKTKTLSPFCLLVKIIVEATQRTGLYSEWCSRCNFINSVKLKTKITPWKTVILS